MKSPIKLLGALVFALFTASCIENENAIRVNKDGSGTITQTMLLSAEALAMAQEGGEDPVKDLLEKDKAAAAAANFGEGVTLESVEPYEKDGRKGSRMVFAFKDINKVKFAPDSALSDMGEGMPGGAPGDAPDAAGEKKSEPVTFTYKDGVLTVNMPAEEKPAADTPGNDAEDPMADQMMAMIAPMLKDMRIAMKIEIPGGIEESDATHVDGTTVTLMDLPMGKLVSDPAKLKKLNQLKDGGPAEIAAAFNDVDGLKFETKNKITIKLK